MTDHSGQAIAVIGAGAMGRGIAQVFAQSGFDVALYDAVPEAIDAASKQIHKLLDRAVEKGRMSVDDAGAVYITSTLHRLNNDLDPDPVDEFLLDISGSGVNNTDAYLLKLFDAPPAPSFSIEA